MYLTELRAVEDADDFDGFCVCFRPMIDFEFGI